MFSPTTLATINFVPLQGLTGDHFHELINIDVLGLLLIMPAAVAQKRFGISILLVTHDQDEAMMMSDRIAVMAEGRIVQIGSPSDVYLHPATPLWQVSSAKQTWCRGTDDGHAVVVFKDAALGRARLPADGRTLIAGDAVLVAVRPERLRLSTLKGTPSEIADDMQTWFENHAVDGFLIQPSYLPGGLNDFVDLVIPELQSRGLFRTE